MNKKKIKDVKNYLCLLIEYHIQYFFYALFIIIIIEYNK